MKRYIKGAVKPLSDLDRDSKRYIAQHECNPDILEELSRDASEYVRMAVAHNPNTPLQIVEKLIGDDYSLKVSEAALSNKSVTPEVLISLVDTSYPIVVWRIAGSKRTPTDVLQYIIDNYPNEIGKSYAYEELARRSSN